jgi:hypothetical protein
MPEQDQLTDSAPAVGLTDEQLALLERLGVITVAFVDDDDGPRLDFDGELVFDLNDPSQCELAERLGLLEMREGDTGTFALRLPAVPSPVVPDDRGRIVRRATVQGFTVAKRVATALSGVGRVRPRIRERSPRRSIRRASCRARSPGRKPDDPDPHHVSAGRAQ